MVLGARTFTTTCRYGRSVQEKRAQTYLHVCIVWLYTYTCIQTAWWIDRSIDGSGRDNVIGQAPYVEYPTSPMLGKDGSHIPALGGTLMI